MKAKVEVFFQERDGDWTSIMDMFAGKPVDVSAGVSFQTRDKSFSLLETERWNLPSSLSKYVPDRGDINSCSSVEMIVWVLRDIRRSAAGFVKFKESGGNLVVSCVFSAIDCYHGSIASGVITAELYDLGQFLLSLSLVSIRTLFRSMSSARSSL